MSRFTEAEYQQLLRRHRELATPPELVAAAAAPPRRRRSTKTIATPTKASIAGDYLIFQCRAAGLPIPEREVYFALPDRRWRFDLAWPPHRLALEIEGLVFPEAPRWNEAQTEHRLSGRHASAAGFLADLEKYGEAWARGWSLLRCTHKQIESGVVLQLLERRFKLPVIGDSHGDRHPDQSQPR